MDWRDLLKLGGIAILVVGLALRLRTTIVVVTAAMATGLLAGIPLFSTPDKEGIINMLGRAFADNRLMTLFIITLPAIGLAERFGLQEQSARLIKRIRAATVGRLLIVYQLFRVLVGVLGVRVNGHAAFVRPLVFPMSVGAAEATTSAKRVEVVPEETVEKIKAANAASENYGNFYGQNLNPVQAGIQLVAATLAGLGHPVKPFRLVLFAIPITAISILLGASQFLVSDRQIKRKAARENDATAL